MKIWFVWFAVPKVQQMAAAAANQQKRLLRQKVLGMLPKSFDIIQQQSKNKLILRINRLMGIDRSSHLRAFDSVASLSAIEICGNLSKHAQRRSSNQFDC